MRTWLIIALLTAVALSGCASEEAPETVDDTSPDDQATADDGNETVDDGDDPVDAGGNATDDSDDANATNEVPVVTFTADVVNGTAPLLVNFTLDVDDDSANLTWAFFVDGNETRNGDGADAAFNHTFDVGNHSVEVVVSDEEHVVNATQRITVYEATVPEPVTITGHVTYNAHVMGMCESEASDVPPHIIGWDYVVDTEGFVATWLDSDGESLGSGASGTVPDGAVQVEACSDANASVGILPPPTNGVDWSITATAPQ